VTDVAEVRKTVTVVFADLTGSTGLGERFDPESLRRVMQRYFVEMGAALEGHGGTVEKFIGDAVMAVFGIPHVHEDDALRAVRAAAEMRERLAQLNDDLEPEWGVRLDMRIGVNTGEVVAGDPTAGQSFATGDAVNVAARLEQAAAPGEILLGETTYRLVRDAVDVERPEELQLRGKSEASRARRLLAVHAGAPGHVRRLDTPMIGRERELSLLGQAYERAVREESCHLFTLLGAAGIGKSRLVEEFVARLGETRVLRGRCLPYGEGITYWPIAEIVKQAAEIRDEESPGDASARIAAIAGDEAVGERIAAAIGLAEERVVAEETFWAVRRFLEELARRQPVVVVFDDIQWGEPTFLELLEHVVDLSREAPLLVLCLARPELLDERPGWGGGKLNATSILLEQLPPDESALLVANLLGARLPDAIAGEVARRAEGNPLFVEELLATLVEESLLRRENGGWALAADLSRLSLPPTIQALLTARLDRLAPGERGVIERGAVEGEVFHLGSVRELLGAADYDVEGSLERLVRKELVRPVRAEVAGDEAYRFKHLLVRDAAYATLPKEVRSDLHQRFADWLERTAGERLVEYEEILGYHLEQAYGYRAELGRLDEAARRLAHRAGAHLDVAGRRAGDRGDMPAARKLLERALALFPADAAERPRAENALAWVLQLAGEFSLAESHFDSAIAAAAAQGDRGLELRSVVGKMEIRNVVHTEGAAAETFELVEAIVPELTALGDDQALADAWRLASYAHTKVCRYGAAVEALERGLAHAERAGDGGLRGEILAWLPTRIYRGPMHAEPALGRCRELLERASGDGPAEAGALAGIALLEAISGRFDEARAAEARSRAIKEELGLGFMLAVGHIWRGEVELLAGDATAAERAFRAAADFLSARGEKGFYPTAAAELAEALLDQGRPGDAWESVRAAEAEMASDDLITVVLVHGVSATLLALDGRQLEAERKARQGVEAALATDDLSLQSWAFLALAEVVGEAAATALQDALRVAEQKGNVVLAGRARERLAALAAQAGS
jgi:class 3 adenylate cyclase/tetratricopeptide (TPR) repeat protein